MAQIKIHIFSPDGTTQTPVEVPDDVPMRRLLPAVVTKMGLPVQDSEGNAIIYKFRRNKTSDTVADGVSLGELVVETDEGFTLIPERIAAGAKTEWWRPKFEKPDKEVLESIDLSAPVYIPTRDSLAIGLVPADMVYRLEEYRSDQLRWDAIMWVFIGAVLGVLANWVTSDPLVISKPSIILMVVFIIMVGITWFATREYKNRADRMKSQLLEFRRPTSTSKKG